jgi:hypothetical protein
MSAVELRVVRAPWCHECSHSAGAILEADKLEAIQLLDSGRAELCDMRKFPKLRTFALSELRQIMRKTESTPNPGSPRRPWPR